MNDELKYVCNGNTVEFNNSVVISQQEMDALFKLKAQVTCMPSFIWSELLRLGGDQDSLIVRFSSITNFKRKEKALEILSENEHFMMKKKEIQQDNKKNIIELHLTKITPEFRSIIPLI